MLLTEVFIWGHGLRRGTVHGTWQQESEATGHHAPIDRKERMDRYQDLTMKPQDPVSVNHAFQ